MSRVFLFGATGYTGRLTARCLVEAGCRPVLCGRSARRLELLAEDLGNLATHLADAADPASLTRILEPGDVLITTVGPFQRLGEAALRACIDRRAVYIDSSGEPPFIRDIFETWSLRARDRCALLPACGFDYLPGNLAGALALERAGKAAESVAICYSVRGAGSYGWASGGTLASAAGAAFRPWFRFRQGRIVDDRPAARSRSFRIGGHSETAVSIGGSEHFTLPAISPGLRNVDVFFSVGALAPALQIGALWAQSAAMIPGARALADWSAGFFSAGGSGGPSDQDREHSGFVVVGQAFDRDGNRLAHAELIGPNGYTFTARLLAWAGMHAAREGVRDTGALSLVEAFDSERVLDACIRAGLENPHVQG